MSNTIPFRLQGIDHIVLTAHAPDKLVDFYVHVLGCTLVRTVPEVGLQQLRAGDEALIDIVPRKGTGTAGAEGNVDHFCLRIHPFDADALDKHLRNHNVATVGGVAKRFGALGYGASLYIRDPEGNIVELKALS